MGEIVNLRRLRKGRARAEAAAQAEANRVKHGVSKRERDLVKARDDLARRAADSDKLDEKT